MSEPDSLQAARNLLRQQGVHESPSVGLHVPELRTPIKWTASVLQGQAFRPDIFEIVVWRFGVPFAQVERLHIWLETNEVDIARKVFERTREGDDSPPLASYLGTYLEADAGGPRYETLWGLRGAEQNGVFSSAAAEQKLVEALGPAVANPDLRDLVSTLRGYWVRDPGATDHRYGQARHYQNLATQNAGCFWDVTRASLKQAPV